MVRPARTEVAVTGMGVLSAAGVGLADFHQAQLAGRSAVRTISHYDSTDDAVRIAGEVDLPPGLSMDRREQMKSDRCTQLAAAAAALALDDAGLASSGIVDPERVGVLVGSGIGGAGSLQNNWAAYLRDGPSGMRPRAVPMGMINDSSASVAIRYGFTGPCTTVATACASGADAIATAHQMIASGEVDVVLAGGSEAPVVRGIVSGFDRLGALSHRNDQPSAASRPFSRDRDGFVIAEGAALLVLESADHAEARGARVHALLRGYGRTSDAHHVTMPHPDGEGARRAMVRALHHADAGPADVGMINAHGTATTLNDRIEANAVRAVFGPLAVPVTATKALTGHGLGASGAIEAVAAVQALSSGLLPPVGNLDDPEPELDIDLVRGEPRRVRVELILSNSFAFGGHNVVLAFGRP